MICRKCGAELDDTAAFCYKCGSFVMRPKNQGISEIPKEALSTGKRKRGRGNFWLYFKPIALLVGILAGVIAGVMGYNAMVRDINQRMYGQPEIPTETSQPSEEPLPSAEAADTAE